MNQDILLELFREIGVMQVGHFQLTSGRHSDKYMQCARLFEYSEHSEALCRELATRFKSSDVQLVVGPALGGVIMSYEVSRQLGVRNIFAERKDGVTMSFRRGFYVEPGTRVLVVEDVVTTGGSVKEAITLLEECGAEIVGVGVIVDRSNGTVDFGVCLEALLSMEVVSFEQADCPLCGRGEPISKPGSRR